MEASSPHTRGSSPAGRIRIGRGMVVPAHAGVIRWRGPWPTRSGRRPRTRGGHPEPEPALAAVWLSSPHTRGSSCTPPHTPMSGRVVPAHAGVIRRPRCRTWRRSSRPRTRGGHPGNLVLISTGTTSSPHTRGSSLQHGPARLAPVVVPAHAGVILNGRNIETSAGRRPRTRGGHPSATITTNAPEESSPHTRGSSLDDLVRPAGHRVVPAHAGVIRMATSSSTRRPGRPRTRGGHPRSAVPVSR